MSANVDDFETNMRNNVYYRFSLMYMHLLPKNLRKTMEFVTLFIVNFCIIPTKRQRLILPNVALFMFF